MPPRAPGDRSRESPSRVRVLLVWRHRILGEATAARLKRRREVELVGATGRFTEAEGILRRAPVDVVLLDASLDAGRAVELTYALEERFPRLDVVAFGLPSEERAVELIEAGATDVLPSEATLGAVVRAVVATARGPAPTPLRLAARVAARIEELATTGSEGAPRPAGAAGLSDRELEVLTLVARGLRNKEIAHRLGIRTATVKNHVHAVLKKLAVRRRRDAVRRAYETGLLEGSFRWRVLDGDE